MEKSNEEEVYEECYEDNKNEEKKEVNKINEEKKEDLNNNNQEEENKENKEKKEDKYIPYTIKQAQDKLKEEDSLFPENDKKDDDEKSDSEEENIKLSEEEKKDIEEKVINERKNAGVLYKNGKDALKYNKDYSKALCNKMLLLKKKEEYLEAYEDFKRLKTLDYNLWENYRNLEGELSYKAEIQKKKMTDEMLGKLKDMGNTILGKFGLSLNNFQMTPNGQGGYSIQYNNNK